jgi:YVTN family beta-propeller protein
VFDASTGTVYAINADGMVSVVDARRCNARDIRGCGRTPATVAPGNAPFALAIDDATHTLYVTNSADNTVSVINSATCNAMNTSGCALRAATVAVGPSPFGLAVDPRTNTVYVANVGTPPNLGDTVSVIDGAICNANNQSGCGQQPATITVGLAPWSVAIDAADDTAYVTDAADNAVSMVDTQTCRASHTSGCAQTPPTVAVGNDPQALAVDTRTDTVYVGNDDDATISLINGAACSARDTSGCSQTQPTFPTLGAPGGLAVNQRTNRLFVSNGGSGLFSPGTANTARGNTVSVISTTSCNATNNSGCAQPAPAALTGAIPSAAAVDAATDTAYVGTNDDTLTVINASTCNSMVHTGCGQTVPAAYTSGSFSTAIDYANHTAYAWGTAFDGGPSSFAVLDTSTCNTSATTECRPSLPTIPTQLAPVDLAIYQATDTLYATNAGPGNTVSVINGMTCNASVTSGCANTPQTVTVGNTPLGVAVNQATHTIYVANNNDNTVSVISGNDCNATNTAGCGETPPSVPLGSPPVALAVNQRTDTIYVLEPGTPSTVAVVDGAHCNATVTTGCSHLGPTITVGNSYPGLPAELAVNDATNSVYVGNSIDNTVSVINGATCNGHFTTGCNQRPTVVTIGRGVADVAVDPGSGLVYVSNSNDDTVSIIDGANCNGTITSGCAQSPPSVPAGGRPRGIAIDATDHNVYVADADAGTTSFFKFQVAGPPANVTATPAGRQAELSWQAPSDGGLPIIYEVVPTPACPHCGGLSTPSTSGLPLTTVTGLTPSTTYTFRVRAVNAAGAGPLSAASNPVSSSG